jgi:Uma2 family endonuclease
MATETRITNEQYERLALDDPNRTWELWGGQPREKRATTAAHEWLGEKLSYLLMSQLDWSEYQVRSNKGRVYRPGATYFVPDVFVIPTAAVAPFLPMEDVLEVYDQPLPLVVEIWSRSTGGYDVEEKLAAYKARGDLEIWYIHPYQQTLTAWRRQPVGSYEVAVYTEGVMRPVALPGVEIDLPTLFNA